jgi:hypothetical protein
MISGPVMSLYNDPNAAPDTIFTPLPLPSSSSAPQASSAKHEALIKMTVGVVFFVIFSLGLMQVPFKTIIHIV